MKKIAAIRRSLMSLPARVRNHPKIQNFIAKKAQEKKQAPPAIDEHEQAIRGKILSEKDYHHPMEHFAPDNAL